MRLTPKTEFIGTNAPSSKETFENKILHHPNSLSKDDRAFLAQSEVEKSDGELELLGIVDDLTNVFAKRYGGTPYHLPSARVHLIKAQDFWKKYREHTQPLVHNRYRGDIRLLAETRNDPHIELFLLLQGYFQQKAKYVAVTHEGEVASFRSGLFTYAHPAQEVRANTNWRYFEGAQAAIVEELALQVFAAALHRAQSISELKDGPKNAWNKIFSGTFVASEHIEDVCHVRSLPLISTEGYFRLDFQSHREVIEYVCEMLHEDQPTKYPTTGSAHEAFFRVFFTDSWMQIGRALSHVFGPEALRILGCMTSEKKSAIHTLELLQRLHKKTKRTSAPRPAFSPSVAPVLNPNVEATIGTNGEKELRERRKGEDTFTSKKRELFLKLKQRNTKELRSYVALADQITADYMQEIGLEPTHIDQKNVHFLQDPTSDFLWKQHGFNAGQTVVVNADLVHRPRQLLNTVIHELLHAKGFSFLHETSKEGLSRVSGVKRAEGHSASIVHFDGLNEAIVQLLTQRAFAQISDQHPLVAEHTDWQDSPEGEKALRRFEKRSRMDREFIFDVDRQGKMGGGRSYFHLVKTLRFVIESIYHDYQDTFKTPDDVTHVFGRALFDGNCEPLERLVNHAFGETAFLVLRDMGTDLADGQRTLLLLQKMRISELKQRKTRPSL